MESGHCRTRAIEHMDDVCLDVYAAGTTRKGAKSAPGAFMSEIAGSIFECLQVEIHENGNLAVAQRSLSNPSIPLGLHVQTATSVLGCS